MKLELKHLRLGDEVYGASGFWVITSLRKNFKGGEEYVTIENSVTLQALSLEDFQSEYSVVKRPLSDLSKEIEINGENFIPITELLKLSNFNTDTMSMDDQLGYIDTYKHIELISFLDAEKLKEWNFDVYDLIGNKLAIDINTIK